MEGLCLLCDAVTLGSAPDDLPRLKRLLGLTVTPFSESHSKLCVSCDGKLGAVEMMLGELRALYIESGRTYSLLVDVAEEKQRQLCQRADLFTVGTQTGETAPEDLLVSSPRKIPAKRGRKPKATSEVNSPAHATLAPQVLTVKSAVAAFDMDTYTCPICSLIFGMRTSFRKHLKSHTAAVFECRLCRESFTRIFDLCTHYDVCVRKNPQELAVSVQVSNNEKCSSPLQVQKSGTATTMTRSMRRKCEEKDDIGDAVGEDGSVAVGAVSHTGAECDISVDVAHALEVFVESIPMDSVVVKTEDMEVSSANEVYDMEYEPQQSRTEADFGGERCSVSPIKSRVKRKLRKGAHKENKPKLEHFCQICGKGFGYLQSMQRHQTVHSEERPFSCPDCGQKFKWAQSLKTHKVGHSGIRPYVCHLCAKTFRGKSPLNQHLMSHRGEKVFSCQICKAAFTRATRLKIHIRSHTGERPYQCEECGMGFADPQIFKKHQMNHRGEKPHVCADCGKGFVMAKYLTEHQKLHTGERAYLCATCGAKFANSGRLKRHMEVHIKSKRYQCEYCPEAFSYKESLNAHVNCHMGVKPYSCTICPKSFTHRAGLNQHKIVHSKDWQHTCATCKHKFSTAAKLRRHSKRHTKHENAVVITEGGDTTLNGVETSYLIEMGSDEVPVIGEIVETGDVTVEETIHSSESLMEVLRNSVQGLQSAEELEAGAIVVDPQPQCSTNILPPVENEETTKHTQVIEVTGWKPNLQSQAVTIPVHVQNLLSTYNPDAPASVVGQVSPHTTLPGGFVYRQIAGRAAELQVMEGDLRRGVTIVKLEVPRGTSSITLPTPCKQPTL